MRCGARNWMGLYIAGPRSYWLSSVFGWFWCWLPYRPGEVYMVEERLFFWCFLFQLAAICEHCHDSSWLKNARNLAVQVFNRTELTRN
jgi:hypothetical protein